jgi:hypothetical protein
MRTEPMRISSPGLRSVGARIFFPLTNVPFLLPLSLTANPASEGTMRAWWLEQKGSGMGMSLSAARPRPVAPSFRTREYESPCLG